LFIAFSKVARSFHLIRFPQDRFAIRRNNRRKNH
jgi:hypothetical protein